MLFKNVYFKTKHLELYLFDKNVQKINNVQILY